MQCVHSYCHFHIDHTRASRDFRKGDLVVSGGAFQPKQNDLYEGEPECNTALSLREGPDSIEAYQSKDFLAKFNHKATERPLIKRSSLCPETRP